MHISLDSALGRQRRLNQIGESITQIAPNPAAAYSLRSLTGGDPRVVRVRIGGTTTEKNFTASEVSSGALLAFVGSGNDGLVSKWYDQSGNGNDAVQGSDGSQPKIVDATDGFLADGITFDGSNDVLTSDFNSSLTDYTFAGVYKVKTIIDNTGLLGKGTGSNREFFLRMKANGTIEHRIHSTGSASPFFQIVSDATISANTTFLLAGSFKDSTNSLRLDISDAVKTGASSINLNSGTSSLTIPSALGNEAHTAIKELLFYSSDQSSKLSDIRTNINNYYSIF